MNAEPPLRGKVALVTGGSRGIGRGIAERLARDGALVAVHHGTRADAARATVTAIEAAGGRAFTIGELLGSHGDGERLLAKLDEELRERTGDTRLDILVNNAGIGGQGTDMTDTTPAAFDEVFAVNTRGPFFVTQAALERMPSGGRIITVSSAVCRVIVPGALPYSMTKAALETMSWWLAKELAPRGITVNVVAPGVIETDMVDLPDQQARDEAAAVSAFNRIGQPKDVAAIVAFLATDEAGWVTGEIIDASGGSIL